MALTIYFIYNILFIIRYVKLYGKDFKKIQDLMQRGIPELQERYNILLKGTNSSNKESKYKVQRR